MISIGAVIKEMWDVVTIRGVAMECAEGESFNGSLNE